MKSKLWLMLIPILASCGNSKKSDAYGNFEAVEVLVSAEAQGKLLDFGIEEGQKLTKNQKAGYIDTFSLYLKKQQLKAQIESSSARSAQVTAQVAVQDEQKRTYITEQKRVSQLVASNAVPTKQLDDIQSQLSVIESQIAATKTQTHAIWGEIKALRFQIAQIDDQIARSLIISPVGGTVLETFAEAGEIVIPGKVLYKIANLEQLILRVYVSGAQLPHVKLGHKVKVYIDETEHTNKQLSGTVTWISQQAEFTPKIIQTKEERVNMVYALKIIVQNDGSLKIGMPGEVNFE